MSRRYKKYYENEWEEARAQLRLATFILVDIKRETGEIDDPNYTMLPSRFTAKALAHHVDPDTTYPIGMARDILERVTTINDPGYIYKTELLDSQLRLEPWIEKQQKHVVNLRKEIVKIKI